MLCSVPDQDRTLAELSRVLRPDGELRFYEHVIPNCQPKRLLLQCADHSGLWPKIAGGCHPARDTTTAIERAGFEIKASDSGGARRLAPAGLERPVSPPMCAPGWRVSQLDVRSA